MAPGLAYAADGSPAPSPAPAPAPAPAPQSSDKPDFFFSPPRYSISIRASWLAPSARSDWFDFVEQQLTLDRGDFNMFGIAGDVSLRMTPRLDLVMGGDYSGHTSGSEYRDFVDNNRLPIQQNTRLREGSVTGGVRYALRNRGRAVSTLAWVPTRFVPYAGGGGGVLWYDLNQYGDFVDFTDFSVFSDSFPSHGAAALAYVDGGVDVQLVQHVFATFDARYKWASAKLDEVVWNGFQPLDLGGLRLSTGISVTF
jgi:hypothetical protein